jgi:hypothetical protein
VLVRQRRRARARQALENRGGAADRARAEKQLIALLALPLARPDAVAVLGLSAYPRVMSLLAPSSRKARAPPPARPWPRRRGGAAPAARLHGSAAHGAGPGAPAAGRPSAPPLTRLAWRQGPRPGVLVPMVRVTRSHQRRGGLQRPGGSMGATCMLGQLLPLPAPVRRLQRDPSARAQEMAAKIVATLLEAGVEVGELGQVETLFDFIAPLTADLDGADAGQDEEVRRPGRGVVPWPCADPNPRQTPTMVRQRVKLHSRPGKICSGCAWFPAVSHAARGPARPVGSEGGAPLSTLSGARPRPSGAPPPEPAPDAARAAPGL